jgi:hypothetical protein
MGNDATLYRYFDMIRSLSQEIGKSDIDINLVLTIHRLIVLLFIREKIMD